LQQESQHAEALALLALVVSAQGRKEEALLLASDAVALESDNAWYYYVLATVQINHHEVYDAIKCLHEAIRLNPGDAEYYAQLSWCFSHTQQYDHAHWCVLKALELNSEHIKSLLQYGIIKYEMKKYAEAEVIFKHVLTEDPENALCHEYFGWMRLNDLETGSAQHHFVQSLQLQPESVGAQTGIKEAEKLHLRLGEKLFQQVSRWYEKLECSKENVVHNNANPQLDSMIDRDCQMYAEEPKSVTFTQSIQYSYNPFEERPFQTEEESEEIENGGMSVKTQLLMLKLVIGLWVLALVIAVISVTKW